LVPESARDGDIICILGGDTTIPYVLLPRTFDVGKSLAIDEEIRSEIEGSAELKLKIEHYDFVGECFIDGWMFEDEERWGQTPNEYFDPRIFAIH